MMNLRWSPPARIAHGMSKLVLDSSSFTRPTRSLVSKATAPYPSWKCRACQQRLNVGKITAREQLSVQAAWSRAISHSTPSKDAQPHASSATSPPQAELSSTFPDPSPLPSQTETRWSPLAKRMMKLLDGLLARLSVASQHINIYTGTDYSGIEALRKEIAQQEDKVLDCREREDTAKADHNEAVNEQASAQREVVGLLERKASWSPADLERYMALVRSQHRNDQAVQSTKDELTIAERDLESARSLLERLERKQYHEEQLWSDTIRRNSTWVTFGLMGVNILLLLAQIAIFEPWRRRKIVGDVKLALDERSIPLSSDQQNQLDQVPPLQRAGMQDANILDTLLPPTATTSDTPAAAGKMLPADASDFAGAVPDGQVEAPAAVVVSHAGALRDLFSDRLVSMRMVDVTTTALQGMATGAAAVGVVLWLWRLR